MTASAVVAVEINNKTIKKKLEMLREQTDPQEELCSLKTQKYK